MSMFSDDKLLFEEDHTKGAGSRGGTTDSGQKTKSSNRSRMGAARGARQVLFKGISTGKTTAEASNMLKYVTRNGDEKLHLKSGEIAAKDDGDLTVKDVLKDWTQNFSTRANAANISHMVMSAPAGTNPADFKKAALEFGDKILSKHISRHDPEKEVDDYNWGVVFHGDTSNPHAHFLVVKESKAAPSLNWNKSDYRAMKEAFVEIAKEHGIDLVVTARKSPERSEPLKARKQREREGSSYSDRNAAKEVLLAMRGAGNALKDSKAKDETRAIEVLKTKMDVDRKAYNELASSMSFISKLMDKNNDVTVIDKSVKMLRLQAMSFRKIQSRADKMEKLTSSKDFRLSGDIDKDSEKLAQVYRLSLGDKKPSKISPISEDNLNKKLLEFEKQFGKKIEYLAQYSGSDNVKKYSSNVREMLAELKVAKGPTKGKSSTGGTEQQQELEREQEQERDDFGR